MGRGRRRFGSAAVPVGAELPPAVPSAAGAGAAVRGAKCPPAMAARPSHCPTPAPGTQIPSPLAAAGQFWVPWQGHAAVGALGRPQGFLR